MDLLNSLQSVRKFRAPAIASNHREQIADLQKRVRKLEKLLLNVVDADEPQAPEGFFPLHHYYDLKPDVSETQVRKWLDEAVKNGTAESGRWRSKKTKKFCKWYRAKSETPVA